MFVVVVCLLLQIDFFSSVRCFRFHSMWCFSFSLYLSLYLLFCLRFTFSRCILCVIIFLLFVSLLYAYTTRISCVCVCLLRCSVFWVALINVFVRTCPVWMKYGHTHTHTGLVGQRGSYRLHMTLPPFLTLSAAASAAAAACLFYSLFREYAVDHVR